MYAYPEFLEFCEVTNVFNFGQTIPSKVKCGQLCL